MLRRAHGGPYEPPSQFTTRRQRPQSRQWLERGLDVSLGALGMLMVGIFMHVGTLHWEEDTSTHIPGVLPHPGDLSKLDAIIVAAGGQTEDGPPPHVAARLDKVVQLYQAAATGSKPKVITTAAGTPHKPSPRDVVGFERHEASDNAKYLIERGLAPDDVWEEGFSLETIGNAFFARVMHCEAAGLRSLAIINSEFHMSRTRAVFDFVFSLPPVHGKPYHLRYVQTENRLPEDVLKARQEKERDAVPRFAPGGEWQKCCKSLQDLHSWINTENMAYSSRRLLTPRAPLDPALLKSY